MSRSGYSDDIDNWDLIRWRGMVASSIRGKRGQQFFRDLLAALDAMPEKRLIAGDLRRSDGEVCAIGALGVARGVDLSKIDPTEPSEVSAAFNIAECLAQEVAYFNDEVGPWQFNETPEQRWVRMRAWVESKLKPVLSRPGEE